MKTKILSLLTTLALLALPTAALAQTAPAGNTQPYSDVTYSTPHAQAIYTVTGLGVMVGVGGGQFDPTAPLTRAEYATIALRADGLGAWANQPQYVHPANPVFTDGMHGGVTARGWGSMVPGAPGAWYVGDVNAAAAAHLVIGYPDGTFAPLGKVTLQQAEAVALHLIGASPPAWPDVVSVAQADGLTAGLSQATVNCSGGPNSLTPGQGSCTIDRAQAAQVFVDALGYGQPQPLFSRTLGMSYVSVANNPQYADGVPLLPTTIVYAPNGAPLQYLAVVGAEPGSFNTGPWSQETVAYASSVPFAQSSGAPQQPSTGGIPAAVRISGGNPIVPGQPINLTATLTATVLNAAGQPISSLPSGYAVEWHVVAVLNAPAADLTPTGALAASITLPPSPPGGWEVTATLVGPDGMVVGTSNGLSLTNQ